ncbi:uncharacterized protein LOC141640842 [Silene latifolia]|uniref:uncharacterized protein LOC141640842 n=1 Tax=Silene latifolia TaxID=37657 RepID=UPI003D781176
MSVEVGGGIKANGLAIMTDVAYLLSDVAAFALSLFSLWAAGWEATLQQSYGFLRVEILSALVRHLSAQKGEHVLLHKTADACLVKENVKIIPIWVKLQGLDIKYWGMDSLRKIGIGVGKVIKCDDNTSVNVEYEWLPISCGKCNGIGHSQEQCKVDLRKDIPRKVWKLVAQKPVAKKPVMPQPMVVPAVQHPVARPPVGGKDKGKTAVRVPVMSPVFTPVMPQVKKATFPTPARILSRFARNGPDEPSTSKGPSFTFMDALNSAIQMSMRKSDGKGTNNVGLFGLLETRVKCSNWNKVHNNICKEWSIFTNNSCHRGGRIWLLWNPNLFTVNVIETTPQTIFAEVMDNVSGGKFNATLVYGFNKLVERGALWAALLRYAQRGPKPWIVLGDLNNETSHSCGLQTVKTIGAFFSWNNKQEVGSRVFSRIDRVMGNVDWCLEYDDCLANFLLEELYDHSPCIISLKEQMRKKPRPFKYFNMWSLDEQFKEVVA